MGKFKQGRSYMVEFWDHAQHTGNTQGALLCRVYGEVISQSKTHVELATWLCLHEDDYTNKESFAIVKSAIIRSKALR